MNDLTITSLVVKDIRFPTSLELHGSDAIHTDPDYSCAYVILSTEDVNLNGHGLSFTCGRGTEVVVAAVKALEFIVLNQRLEYIFNNFNEFWRKLSSDSQIRWIGPEKGVIHLATSAIVNALWDLWAKLERKPLWKLLVDMEPEKLVSTIDFRYISDALTKEEAIEILKTNSQLREKREAEIKQTGYPCYTTGVGWIGYDDDRRRQLCRDALSRGFTRFKAKVGDNLENEKHRLQLIREEIGWDNVLMVDANQAWDVKEAIDRMIQLAPFKLLWIEEPTSPDDIVGHAEISRALKPYGIGVASGEQIQNRVMFKQYFQVNALQFCQLDAVRLGGVNEVLAVILLAHKYKVPICPHGGGVGLCEYIIHLSVFDYISVSGSLDNRMVEFVDHLHEHFHHPVAVDSSKYLVPQDIGYGGHMKQESMDIYEYPSGQYWRNKTSQ